MSTMDPRAEAPVRTREKAGAHGWAGGLSVTVIYQLTARWDG